MSLFFILLAKILPLYFTILLGYLCVRFLRIDKGTVAAILFYIIGPVVVFHAVISVEMNPAVLLLPVFFYLLSSAIAFLTLHIFGKRWADSTANILAFTAGTGNTGYFGIALALVLFEPAIADIYIFAVLGSFFYESTTGYYVTARGSFTAGESLRKVLKLPALYAFLAAISINYAGLQLPDIVDEYSGQFKIVFSVLGMMLIGMGFERWSRKDAVDRAFLAISLTAKFVFWPLLILALIVLDRVFVHLLDGELHRVMLVFAIVPLAGNTVTLAVLLKAHPEKAAFAVLLSTLVSLFSIPLMLSVYEMM